MVIFARQAKLFAKASTAPSIPGRINAMKATGLRSRCPKEHSFQPCKE